MLHEIVIKTPPWVFALFFALLALGVIQSRPRQTRRAALWALPAGMTLFSIAGTGSAFGASWVASISWLAGFAATALHGAFMPPSNRASYEPASGRFLIAGSWVPLALMMAIFFTKYAVGVVLARQLPLAGGSGFAAGVSLAYGAFSGIFVARAWGIWRCQAPGSAAPLRLPLSRRALLLGTFGLLALLDLGRSQNAHYGYDAPAEVWNPDPLAYADIVWPPGADTPPAASPTEKLYLRHCAVCHGPNGRGNGAAAPSMIPRPRDFTRGEFKYKSTLASSPPSDADLRQAIGRGLHASGMPGFDDILSETQIDGLVAYVKQFSRVFDRAAQPVAMTPRPPVTPAAIARGEALYRNQGCVACHGADLRGGAAAQDAKGYPVISRDLTAPWTFRGGDSPQQIYLRLSTGMAPAPMPAYDTLGSGSRWDLVAFLESRRRIPPWQAGGVLAGPAQAENLEQRGRYLVRSEMCGLCHTEVNPNGIYRDDRYLAGGMRVVAHPQGVFVSANLTPDDDTGLGRWSEAEIAAAIRLGRAKDGRLLNFWGMPWMYLHNLGADDALAIARYLKTLPPVRNEIPRTLHYGFIETVASKLLNGNVFLGRAPVLTYAIGSYANLRGWRPDRLQDMLISAQWLVLALGLLLLSLSSAGISSPRRGALVRARSAMLIVGGLALWGAGYFAYHSPTLGFLPPEKVAAGASGSIFTPDTSGIGTERAALLRRGRTVFATASCAYCHNNDGSGGFKLSGSNGTVFTPNISSHAVAGIGAWTDQQIARAIRTGVSRSGRPLYWQGMPWDHYANFDEDDVVALVAYLRAMPPVDLPVPPYRPPAADDCKIYTFWTSRNSLPGCG